MNSGEWAKIETICQEALNLAEEDRKSYIEEICGGDKHLLREVNSLLSHSGREFSFLNKPLVGFSSTYPMAGQLADAENKIGRYRLIREIGSGGMGRVFLAVRNDEQFEQYAAIKIIRKEFVTDESIRRFHAERQILASLNHTNIARLYDGGTTDDGLPWFAMEYIDGMPVNQYCDRHKIPVHKRLELFLAVCTAVQYAHQNLVVHRDLKPGNILITEDEIPKLLDFGIAKLIHEETGSAPFQTRRQMMTVEYASPEQNRGGIITTASDIYSLGVNLFELLAGKLPHNLEGKNPIETDSIFQKSKPALPSDCIVANNGDDIAGSRSSTPEKLKRLLKGDLDAIVSKALRYEPAERYTSVEQFSNDIRRYLDGEPVLARKRTLVYESRKFLKRNRWSVGIAAITALLILSFGAFSLYQAGIIEARSVELETERDRARNISSFLTGLFQSADPSVADNADITAKDLLERGVARIDSDLHGQAELQSDLYFVISDVYEKLGQYDEAALLADKALQGWLKSPESAQTEIANAWNRLGWIQFQRGNYAESDSLLKLALGIQMASSNTDQLDLARTLNDLAVLNQAQGNYAKTDSLLNEALKIRKNILGDKHESIGIVLSNLAALKWRTGDFDHAEQLLHEAVEIFQITDYDNLRTAIAMTNLAAILVSKGKYNQAEPYYRDALDIRYKLVGKEHPDVAFSLAHLGNLLRLNKKFDEAEKMLHQAHDLRIKLLGEHHNLTGDSKRTLGLLYFDAEDYQKAERYFLDTITLYREILPAHHVRLAEMLHLAGNVYTKTSQWNPASVMFAEALEIRQYRYGENDLQTIDSMIQLGLVFQQMQESNTARDYLAKSLHLLDISTESDTRKTELRITAQTAIAALN